MKKFDNYLKLGDMVNLTDTANTHSIEWEGVNFQVNVYQSFLHNIYMQIMHWTYQ